MSLEKKVRKETKGINGRVVPSHLPFRCHFPSPRISEPTFSEDETGPLTWPLHFVFVHTPWIDRRYINLREKQEATGHWVRQTPYVTHLNLRDVAFKQINGSNHLPFFKVTSEVTLAHSW